jgi:protease-4
MSKRLFRQEHPILTGMLLLSFIFMMFLGGITFFVSALFSHDDAGDLFGGRDGVGVVDIKGVIISSEDVVKRLSRMRESNSIKAIVLRIDSPGGAVGASQEIYREVQRTGEVKPVVASLGSIAASGGYYAALGAARIIASPGTMTGSLGVILKFANLEELFDKIGYRSETVKSGALKDIGAPDRPMSATERQFLQELIDSVHGQFVKAVASSRALEEHDVHALADGRIFSGEQAQNLGLIDELGNFTDAALLAAKLGGLGEGMPHLVYPPDEDFSLVTLLFGKNSKEMLTRSMTHTPLLSYEWPGKLTGE